MAVRGPIGNTREGSIGLKRGEKGNTEKNVKKLISKRCQTIESPKLRTLRLS